MSLVAPPPHPSAREVRPFQLEVSQLKEAAMVLRAINHPLRRQMLHLLHQSGHLSVTELYTRLGLQQSVASQHLALLRRAGFVTTVRHERFVHYSVNEQRLAGGAPLLQRPAGTPPPLPCTKQKSPVETGPEILSVMRGAKIRYYPATAYRRKPLKRPTGFTCLEHDGAKEAIRVAESYPALRQRHLR